MKTNYPLLTALSEAESKRIVKSLHKSADVLLVNVQSVNRTHILHYVAEEDRGLEMSTTTSTIVFEEGYLPWIVWCKTPMSMMDILVELKIIEP